jgi:hypothetical protein
MTEMLRTPLSSRVDLYQATGHYQNIKPITINQKNHM